MLEPQTIITSSNLLTVTGHDYRPYESKHTLEGRHHLTSRKGHWLESA